MVAFVFCLCTIFGWLLNAIEIGMGIGLMISLGIGYSVFDEK